ncbi:hypothetical protein ONV78_10945 [Hahella sp. CR1]|uniref:tetratricopeptide repeat protein n=1 Tax=Hahella sp. CR1 TaxID=2992807 RepID=UPI002442F0AC|nr:hypothetical protein [Hahella sp. CR1]MDG9668252.1 hypothetical protein [Hahella sp. CR1]
MLKPLRFHAFFLFALVIFLFLISFIYWPGLNGPFLFDDYPNLSPMNNYGGITSFDNLLRFLFETQGSSGRFISLLTFVMNDQAWPASPFSLKSTNLAFHLINALLFVLVVKQLLTLVNFSGGEKYRYYIALIVALIWALHPINVSTVLYAIQRMAQISTLFSLIAMYVTLKFCSESALHSNLWAWVKYSFVFGCIVVVGVFAKENTFVTLFIAGLCIAVFVSNAEERCHYRSLWLLIFVFIPLLLFSLFYFYFSAETMGAAWLRRPFTMDERLMSEMRIVARYIWLIISPTSVGGGLYHDDYDISRSFTAPLSTFYCFLLNVFIIAIAIVFKKNRLFFIGVLWFYIGHSLESTFVPLELYFEHRNYFPMMGLFIAVLGMIQPLLGMQRLKWFFVGVALLLLPLLGFLTQQRVLLWGDEGRLFYTWSKEKPTSSRARSQYVGYLVNQGYFDEAKKEALDIREKIPDELSSYILNIYIECISGETIEEISVANAISVARVSGYENSSYVMLRSLSKRNLVDECGGFSNVDILRVFQSIGDNPKYMAGGLYASNYYYYLGELYSRLRQLSPAVINLDKAYEARPNITFPLIQAQWLADAGLFKDAYRYLDKARAAPPQTRYIKVSDDSQIHNVEKYIENSKSRWEK